MNGVINVLYNNCKSTLPICGRGFAFRSAIALETLYPGSSLKLTTPSKSVDPDGKFNGFIPMKEIDVTYSRSSGPGGQNVDKVNTKVDVRFHLQSAKWLNDNLKTKLADKLKNKISSDGYVIFRSDITRSQQLNLADCLSKLRTAIRTVEVEEATPTPETLERIRRRQEKAAKERLLIKRQRTQIRRDRQEPTMRDF